MANTQNSKPRPPTSNAIRKGKLGKLGKSKVQLDSALVIVNSPGFTVLALGPGFRV